MIIDDNKNCRNIFFMCDANGKWTLPLLAFPPLFCKTGITGGWTELKVIISLHKVEFRGLVENFSSIFASCPFLHPGRTNLSAIFQCDFLQKSFKMGVLWLALLLPGLKSQRLPRKFGCVPWSQMLEVRSEMYKQFVQICVAAVLVIPLCPDCLQAQNAGF